MKKIASTILLGLVVCVATSASYNLLYLRYLLSRNPVPGNIKDVDGLPMHIYCTGSGSPTVVLEGGILWDWLYWQKVQPGLAKTTRVCSYDRAGLGWSELQPGVRNSKNIATQLHSLLQQAGEQGPFLLVGASIGGLYIRQYNSLYPQEVMAMVFVDSSVPEQFDVYGRETPTDRNERHRDANWRLVREATGWERISGNCGGFVGPGLEAYAKFARAEACRPAFSRTWVGEVDAAELSAEEVAHLDCCGELPILVISQDTDRSNQGWTADKIAETAKWAPLQENLKKLSPRSRRIIARSSGHRIIFDRPDVIVSGIGQFVTLLRNRSSDPQEGTTVVQ